MTSLTECTKCGQVFVSVEDYQNHLPCEISSTSDSDDLGYLRQGSEEFDGTGRN